MAQTNGYDLIRWANITTKVPGDRYVGPDRVRRVLVAMALHTGRDWCTYVSRRTLADELDLDPRTVGRAVMLLAGAGLIVATERDGRGLARWRLWPDQGALTGGASTTTNGGASTTTGGDTTEGGITTTGGATGGATGGESTTRDIYKDRYRGGSRTHARTHAREAADGPPTEDQPTPTATAHGEQPFDPYTWSPFCDRHPGGTADPCRACQHRATQYELARTDWENTRCVRDGCTNPIDPAEPTYRMCTRHIALRAAGQ
jgi:DNA-binding transcriptional ArsR family regulator